MIFPASQPTMAPMMRNPIRCISEPPARYGRIAALPVKPGGRRDYLSAPSALDVRRPGDLSRVVQVGGGDVACRLRAGREEAKSGRHPGALVDRVRAMVSPSGDT